MATVTRRILLGAFLGSVAGHALANAPRSSLYPRPRGSTEPLVRPKLPSAETLISQANITGEVGFTVADVRTGAVLEARDGALALPPASVTKAVTALYALERLGPEYRFRTRLIATGTLRNGRLDGDLILAGGGDPTLDTNGLADMAAQLREAGVREVTGRFLVFGNALPSLTEIDPIQPDHVGYNPAISGLNLNFNRVHFEWKQQSGSYALSMDARSDKHRPAVRIAKMRISDRDVPVYTYSSDGGTDRWTVARSALGRGGSRWLPVRKPELYAAEVFQSLAAAQGIRLSRGELTRTQPRGTILVEKRSESLKEILRGMLKFSTNLTAEVVGLTATGSGATTLEGSAAEMTRWARRQLGMRNSTFVDHSGLGGASRVTAEDMVTALLRVRRETDLASILKSVSMRNSKGQPIKDHPVKIRAKTGTLNFVTALAGYMTTRDGRELAFAIFAADVPRRSRITAADGDVPPGTAGWRGRARKLHLRLIDRWGAAFTA